MSRNNRDTLPPSTAQAKQPTAPPPPYTEFPATAAGPSSPHSSSAFSPSNPAVSIPIPMPMPIPNVSSHPGYEPTPLATTQPLLPYTYYAPSGSADSRAKWRFFSALFWAVALWLLFGFLIGVEVWGEEGWIWGGSVWVDGLDGAVRGWLRLKASNGAVSNA